VSHAAVVDQTSDPVIPVEKTPFGITNGKFGMWMFLCQDCMGFVGLFAAYAALRALADKWYDPSDPSGAVLGIWFTALMTFVLICSSVTMVLALDACQRDDQRGLKKWLGLTILGGLFFLCGQVYEYTHLLSESWRWPSAHNFWGTFYSLTSFHGLHVLAGVIYLSCMWVGAARGKYGSRNSTPIEIVGLYWHFVDLVWILLFTFVYLISPDPAHALPVPVAGH
jgi:heme/copper-type cytochrome/quinol oxidase subunit 3